MKPAMTPLLNEVLSLNAQEFPTKWKPSNYGILNEVLSLNG